MPFTLPDHWTRQELRAWRAWHDLKQSDASSLLAVPATTYAHWEQARPPHDIDERMAEAERRRLLAYCGAAALPGENEEQMRTRLAKDRIREAKRLARQQAKDQFVDPEYEANARLNAKTRGFATLADYAKDRIAFYSQPATISLSGRVLCKHHVREMSKLLKKETGQ